MQKESKHELYQLPCGILTGEFMLYSVRVQPSQTGNVGWDVKHQKKQNFTVGAVNFIACYVTSALLFKSHILAVYIYIY